MPNKYMPNNPYAHFASRDHVAKAPSTRGVSIDCAVEAGNGVKTAEGQLVKMIALRPTDSHRRGKEVVSNCFAKVSTIISSNKSIEEMRTSVTADETKRETLASSGPSMR